MTGAVIAGLLAGYGVAMPVGAVAITVMTVSAATSLRVGSAAAVGAATADGVYALLAVVGGATFSSAIKAAAVPLRWTSVLVLLLLSTCTAVRAVKAQKASQEPPTEINPARAFVRLIALTLINPTTIVYFAALVAGARAEWSAAPGAQVAFVLAVFVASCSWQLMLAGTGALLGRAVATRRARLLTALFSSCLIALQGLHLAVQ